MLTPQGGCSLQIPSLLPSHIGTSHRSKTSVIGRTSNKPGPMETASAHGSTTVALGELRQVATWTVCAHTQQLSSTRPLTSAEPDSVLLKAVAALVQESLAEA